MKNIGLSLILDFGFINNLILDVFLDTGTFTVLLTSGFMPPEHL